MQVIPTKFNFKIFRKDKSNRYGGVSLAISGRVDFADFAFGVARRP